MPHIGMQNIFEEQSKLLIRGQASVPCVLGTKPTLHLVLPILTDDRATAPVRVWQSSRRAVEPTSSGAVEQSSNRQSVDWSSQERTSWIEDLSRAGKSYAPGFPDVDGSFVISHVESAGGISSASHRQRYRLAIFKSGLTERFVTTFQIRIQ